MPAPGVRLGSQAPRIRNVPRYSRTFGHEVVDFMGQIGRPLDPWQAAITLDAFGVRSDGLWSAFEVLLALSRQNGKGGVTEAIELGGLFLFREPLILHSAHQFKTSTAAFRRLQDIIDASDWLTRRVKMISRSKGDESIELTKAAGGGRLQFVARTLGSGRGLTGSKTVFDEAAWLTVGQYAAQTPTLATIPNPQIIYTSTPPDEDVGPMPEDAMLPSVRSRGLGRGRRIAMYEWSPQGGYDRTDRDVWYECNPALGIRISEWFLEQQLTAFTSAGRPEKFDTEHLGVWPDTSGSHWAVISRDDYMDACDESSQAVGALVFCLDVNPERSHSAITAVGARQDGDLHGEVIDHRPGTKWVVARAVELNRRWRPVRWVAGPGAVAALIPDLEEAGITVDVLTGPQAQAAWGMFVGAVSSEPPTAPAGAEMLTGEAAEPVELGEDPPVVLPRLKIRSDRHGVALATAVEGATKRRVGDGHVWERRSTDLDISTLYCLTNNVWGFATRPGERPFFGAWR